MLYANGRDLGKVQSYELGLGHVGSDVHPGRFAVPWFGRKSLIAHLTRS